MRVSQEEKIFYEALWISEKTSDGPIVRGNQVENIVNKLLRITKEEPGVVEIYKFIYNNQGYKVELLKKFLVVSELDLDNS